MPKRKALVVDDTPANRDFLERLLEQAGFEVSGAATEQEALADCKELEAVDLAVVDMQLPDGSGLSLTQKLRERCPKAYLVVATMYDERSLMDSTFERGGNCFLVKPHGFMELFKRLTTSDLDELREASCLIIDQYGPRAANNVSA